MPKQDYRSYRQHRREFWQHKQQEEQRRQLLFGDIHLTTPRQSAMLSS